MPNDEEDTNAQRMIVTIDGPAGAGKSTVARALAARLGFEFLDTGGMYRAVALAALRAGVDFAQPAEIERLAAGLEIQQVGDRILLNGEDISKAIRTIETTLHTRYAADNPGVRRLLVAQQRKIAAGRRMVCEGRDQGTVAFPAARCKIFLTASDEERARRRLADLQERQETATFDEVLTQQTARDARDAARSVGPLCKAADAVEVITDGLTLDEVLDQLETLIRTRLELP